MLEVDDPAVSARLKDALFKPDRAALDVRGSMETLAFEFRDSGGLTARKEFTFDPAHPYNITLTSSVTLNGSALQPTVVWGPALGTGVVHGGMGYAPPPQPIFYRDGKVKRVAIKEIESHRREQGAFGFAGVDDHYFLSAVIPSTAAAPNAAPLDLRFDPVLVAAQGDAPALQFISWSVKPGAPGERTDFFFGPKDFTILQAIKPDVVRAIDFGMFDVIVVPLLRALKWVNGYVHNYGWSIIALTVIINLVMFPLRHKSAVSMRKMAALQPEMKAIQDRYAKMKMTDPGRQKMNEEVMALYKRHGANPAAGCVPMLLTLPVLIAFYSMLSVAIELRGAPFIGWIKDLSAHDPYFVTPVLMGVTQFVQTRMTPMGGDPMQQKMMQFMPLMFAGMMLYMPSGLVLYWTVSNIWTIGQQAITNRLLGPAPQHTVRPPAERQLKPAGAGRSPQAAKERK
jgi:YidC/Oxa1 family membrane protein insertase